MPNWCTNEVEITGDNAVIQEIAEIVKANKYGLFQMNDFVPMPEELRDTTAPSDRPNWYNWANSNWGTKWDLDEDAIYIVEDGVIKLGFNTAWSPNCAFWVAFSEKYPTLRTYHKYYEEGMGFIGQAFYEDDRFDDNCQDITPEIWEKCGAVLDENGDVDWDKSDVDLLEAFPL
jgi:hypothetical protein